MSVVLFKGLLGLSIRFCTFDKANENVWHVLDVQNHSPAALAGLRSHTDYIIGADTLLSDAEDLFTLIETNEGRPLKLYVYNSESDMTREVTLTPNAQWGGEGSLGSGIGYGYLHRIPIRTASSIPVTKSGQGSNPSTGTSGGIGEKPPLLSAVPAPNVANAGSMNFTLQPVNMPPLTVTMPNLLVPTTVNSSTTSTTDTSSTVTAQTNNNVPTTTVITPNNLTQAATATNDANQFAK